MSTAKRNSRRYLWLLSVPLLFLALWAEWLDFFGLWYESIIYTHGFLVLAGAIFVLFLRRHALAMLRINGSPLALFLLFGASIVLLLSQAADIRVFRLLLVPILIIFWGCSIWGKDFLKVAGGPILLLIFAVPVWDDLSPLLQHITVFFNNIFLRIAGIEAAINEYFIVLEVGTFIVEDGCSGVRYLMVSLFLAAFYGQINNLGYKPTALLMLLAGLLSMLSNWIRVFGIIAAGHYSNMETSLVEDHELFGWAIFIVFTLIPFFLLSARLGNRTSKEPNTVDASPDRDQRHASPAWVLTASTLIVWPALVPIALQAKTERVASSWNPGLFESVSGWSGPLRHATIWQPDFKNPDINLGGVYVSDSFQQIQVQITGYRLQAQNKELIFHGNKLFDRSEWELVSEAQQPLETSYSKELEQVNETIIRSKGDGEQIIIWSWYTVGEFLTASKVEAKIAGALNKIRGDSRGALWALAGRCQGMEVADCDQQRFAFNRFLQSASF
ncbi:exosortase A [Marinobacter szutsaonensis]